MQERIVADGLLSRFWAKRGVPVDPASIARSAGLSVREFDHHELATASGWYKVVEGVPTILFNPTEAPTRQRFTIAHELGHHALSHGPRPRDSASAFSLTNFDPIEASANRFAAELLMPIVAVKNLVFERNVSSISALASLFGVSEVAMKYRLKNLSIIS